ncbi:hypothetical protein N7457_009352 [Penicillium paradoxum]|uniref:uncharacterized protein n=1 Tax=Penicillium paradoxum TaxID=176176 RepID=UPI002547F728|nr:uncharacterized protein N7457_009352 [Penicillium paradoxum]KAJ5774456.1 hypothetical protein N7457_009352 [Penicillium paradoxum]
MANRMNALQITSTSSTPTLSLSTLPIPTLKPGHALVKIHYACIHPSDRLNAQGLFPSTTLPRVPGRDFSGVVVDTADETSSSKAWIGKEVYGTSGSTLGFTVDGVHAEYCLIPLEALVEKPTSLSLLQAATVGVPFTTALVCLQKAQVTNDDVVLVIGATGAVGSAAVQIAKAMGCKRVLSAARRVEAKPDVILAGEKAAEDLALKVAELTGGRGVDVVIDTVGNVALMGAAIEQLARRGRYAWIAAPRGDVSKMLSFDIFQAYRRELMLVGCNSVSLSIEGAAGLLRNLGEWIEQGLLGAQDEGGFKRVRLEDSIEDGYRKAGEKVVIEMARV